MATHERRVVFFDLDGTLHQQDMFGSFLRYLLRRQPLNALLVLPLLPIIAIVDSICQCNTPFNYLFRCFELQCLSRSVV
ncbi:HAD hydrolase YfhB [Escherichia coli]|nr:HAD hydrolase YfhB [Escherichia coli]